MNNPTARFSVSPLSPHCGGIVTARGHDVDLASLTIEEIRPVFEQYGAILLRSFNSDVDQFMAFTSQFSDTFSSYEGGAFRVGALARQKVNGLSTLLTTTGASQNFAIPLHGEMYYLGKPPALLWFFCQLSPAAGGETTVADGRKIFSALSRATQAFFRENRIKYVRHLKKEQWQQVYETQDLDDVRNICRHNGCTLSVAEDLSMHTEYTCSALVERDGTTAFINSILGLYLNEKMREQPGSTGEKLTAAGQLELQVRMADGSPLPDNIIQEAMQAGESFTAPVPWQNGDVLMINNRTHLHGRRSSPPAPRSILVRMCESSRI